MEVLEDAGPDLRCQRTLRPRTSVSVGGYLAAPTGSHPAGLRGKSIDERGAKRVQHRALVRRHPLHSYAIAFQFGAPTGACPG